jgi:uncharacterized protein DUF6782
MSTSLDEAETLATIPAETRAHALDIAQKAAGELGIETPRVIWFSEASANSRGAYAGERKMVSESRGLERSIWLHLSLRGNLLIETIAHEVRHRHQYETGALSRFDTANNDADYALAEADARLFAAAFMARQSGKPAPV